MKLLNKLKLKMQQKRGQNTAEYVLMLVLVAGAAIGTFTIFGGAIGKRFSHFIAAMNGQDVKEDANSSTNLETNSGKWGMGEFNNIPEGGVKAEGGGAANP
jgi:Flp pilus assembly pilin Flp